VVHYDSSGMFLSFIVDEISDDDKSVGRTSKADVKDCFADWLRSVEVVKGKGVP
jgi:hypothetical protein